jgi:two-component system, sensor histidine kinase LadS
MKKIILFFIILGCQPGFAQILQLKEGQDDFRIEKSYFEIFEDSLVQKKITDVAARDFDGFRYSGISFNQNQKSAYWLKLKLQKKHKGFTRYFLETYAPRTRVIEVYFLDENKNWQVQKGGDQYGFYERQYVNKNLIFDLPVLQKDSVQTFYIRILSNNYSPFEFNIKSANYFIFYITNEYYFLGIFYGVLLVMAIYNFVLYLFGREKVYLYYIAYVLSCGILTMSDDGLGFQYLWASYPALNKIVGYTVAPILLLLTFILYSSSFLSLKKLYPVFYKYLIGLTLLYLVYFIVSNILTGGAFPALYIIPFAVTYGLSWYVYLKGNKATRFFILGFTFILFSIVINQMRAMHIIEGSIFTVYSLNIGLVVEVVVFSVALSDRIRIIKQEKELAQQEIIVQLEEKKKLQESVNIELENKVRERTRELHDKNDELSLLNNQLKDLNKQVNEMNARLDYDNWYLKKDLKEDLEARVLESEISYEEFTKVFKEEDFCCNFLVDKKWSKFYRCRKCGHLKYTSLSDHHGRKCTSCGFVESATAYTLYHGVRFPIPKAFYMTYLFFRKGHQVNLVELSELLQVRRNTCWNFRKKVEESVQRYSEVHKGKSPTTWEDLVLMFNE